MFYSTLWLIHLVAYPINVAWGYSTYMSRSGVVVTVSVCSVEFTDWLYFSLTGPLQFALVTSYSSLTRPCRVSSYQQLFHSSFVSLSIYTSLQSISPPCLLLDISPSSYWFARYLVVGCIWQHTSRIMWEPTCLTLLISRAVRLSW